MKTKKIKSLKELAQTLPRHAYTSGQAPMEPVNLIIIGSKRYVYRHFKIHGWYRADKIGALSIAKAVAATVLNRSYKQGPMYTGYLMGKRMEMAFERPTRADTFRRRHHLRLWRLPYKLRGLRIWAGTVSYDRASGLDRRHLQPTHHIAPTLSWERDFVANSLGITQPQYLKLGQPEKGHIFNDDEYQYDGRALVIDLSTS